MHAAWKILFCVQYVLLGVEAVGLFRDTTAAFIWFLHTSLPLSDQSSCLSPQVSSYFPSSNKTFRIQIFSSPQAWGVWWLIGQMQKKEACPRDWVKNSYREPPRQPLVEVSRCSFYLPWSMQTLSKEKRRKRKASQFLMSSRTIQQSKQKSCRIKSNIQISRQNRLPRNKPTTTHSTILYYQN